MILDEANNIVKNKLLEILDKQVEGFYNKLKPIEDASDAFKNTLLLFHTSMLASIKYPDISKEEVLKILNKYRF